MSYSINAIAYIDNEKFPLSKGKFSNESYLWHFRLGLLNPNRIHDLVKSGNLNSLIFEGKMIKRPFKAKGNCATKQLGLVHIDVCGPISIQVRGEYEYEYFITFTYDYLRYGFLYLMCHKSKAFEKF